MLLLVSPNLSPFAASKLTCSFQEMVWEKSENPRLVNRRPMLKVSSFFLIHVFYPMLIRTANKVWGGLNIKFLPLVFDSLKHNTTTMGQML
jgi:hypothetical protein